MTKESILALLNRDAYQVELGPGGRGITELVKQEIEALDLPGIDFIKVVKETIHMETLLPILLAMLKMIMMKLKVRWELKVSITAV